MKAGLLAAVALILVAATWIIALRPAPASAPKAASPRQAAIRPPAMSAQATPAARTPLPPADAAFSIALPSLRAAAASGNAEASCRLAMELQRCAGSQSIPSEIANLDRLPARPGAAEIIAKRRAELAAKREACEGVAANDLVPWKLMLDAALRGHVPSMARFAGDRALTHSTSAQWDLEAIGAYRDHAYDFLQRAAEAGDVEATESLGVELMTVGFGTRAVPFDPVRGFAYLKALAARATPEYRAQLESRSAELASIAKMSSADLSRATARAAAILPQAALDRLRGARRMVHDARDDFGCR